MKRFALLVALVLCAAGAAAVIAPGGSDTTSVPGSTITDAAAATSATGSFRISGRATVRTSGRTIPLGLYGAMDSARKRGQFVVSVGGITMAEIVDRFVFYMRSPLFTSKLPAGKSWVRMDVEKISKQSFGLDLNQLSGDPSRMVDQLRGVSGKARRLGRERVRGVEATRYRVRVDLRRYVERLPPSERAAARSGIARMAAMGVQTAYPEEIWVDAQRHVRQVRLTIRYRLPAAQGPKQVTMAMTMDLFDFGAPAHVHVPPASSTIDVTKLVPSAARALGSQ